MKKISIISLCLGLLLAAASAMAGAAKGEPGAIAFFASSAEATVQSVDAAKREVTVRLDDGTTRTARVDDRVTGLDKVVPGDIVRFDFIDSLAIAVVKKEEGKPENLAAEDVRFSSVGGKPAKFSVKTVVAEVDVKKIDYKKRTVTVEYPGGKQDTFKVSKDVKRLREIKKGDRVVIKYTETLAITVGSPS